MVHSIGISLWHHAGYRLLGLRWDIRKVLIRESRQSLVN